MPDIEIEDIQFSRPRLDEPDNERGLRRAWTDIAISIRNRSARTTYYLRADLRGVQYEESTATLKLVLAELPPREDTHITFFAEPHFMPVLPGNTAVIHETIPIHMNVLDLSTDDTPNAKVIDISNMQRVEVTAACNTTPFRPVHTDSRAEIQEQLHGWGDRVSHTLERCIPTAQPQTRE